MTRISKLHVLHRTSGGSHNQTDGKILLQIHANNTIYKRDISYLPHDERERNRTDHYKLDVYDLNISDTSTIDFKFETQSTDGWLPASAYVISYNVDGKCKLLAGDESWSSNGWLDKPSYVTGTIVKTSITSAVDRIAKIILLATTGGSANNGSDGAFFLETRQGTKVSRLQLNTSNNDFSKNRSDEYVLNVLSKGFTSDDDLEFELQTTSTDGWLPSDVFILAIQQNGALKLLQAVPDWPKSDYIDYPHTPERDVVSPYPNTDWRSATTVDEDKYYNLKTIFDNLYLGVQSSSFHEAKVEMRRDEANGASQWRFKSLGGGKFQLLDRISGKALASQGLSNDEMYTKYADLTDSSTHFIPARQPDGRWKITYAYGTTYGIEIRGTVKEKATLILSNTPSLFELIPIRKYINPEGTAGVSEVADSEASQFVQNLAVGLAATAIDSKVPGGGVVFSEVFNEIFGDGGPDLNDIFNKFRKQLLEEVEVMMANATRREAVNVLEATKTDYLLSYMGERRSLINQNSHLLTVANRAHEIGQDTAEEMARLLPTFDSDGDIIENSSNISLIRAAFPIYVMAAYQAMNAYQEAAMITAVHPTLSLTSRYTTLAYWEQEFLENINKLFPVIMEDRKSEVRVKFDFSDSFYGLIKANLHDYKLGEGINKQHYVPNGSTPNFDRVTEMYKEHLTFSYEKYLYSFAEAAQFLQGMRNRTEDLCIAIRGNVNGARDTFIANILA